MFASSLTLEQIQDIFKAQGDFNSRVVEGWENISKWSKNNRKKWYNRNLTALIVELVEMLDSNPWKWWKKYPETDMQNIHVEIVDMLHFLVSMYLIEKQSPQDFINNQMPIIAFKPDLHNDFLHTLRHFLNANLKIVTGSFMGVCEEYKLGGQELYDKYMAKLQVNHNRQNLGYSKESKDPEDCKHI